LDLSGLKYLVVGAGFFGSVIAERIANDGNERVVVVDKRDHLGGNSFSEDDAETGIHYHVYGTHIFHTPHRHVWDYLNRFTDFNGYVHQVLTTFKDKVYQMPINLETINSFYGVNLKPYQVDEFLAEEVARENIANPRNFEEKAISLIGRPLYEAFIRGYTKKQWQKEPRELPAAILQRLPFRKNYNESYYFSRWQGIPLRGYACIFEKMLRNPRIEVLLNTDYFDIKDLVPSSACVIYSGPIDRFFDYRCGKLEWRTLAFEREVMDVEDYQGTAVMNYAEETVPYTRIHEPRHLHPEREYPKARTLIVREYSRPDTGDNPYYPINDEENRRLYAVYQQEVKSLHNVIIGGRLGDYQYYDMHHAIENALTLYERSIKENTRNA